MKDHTDSDRAIAIAYVRGSFFPPMPNPYADWLLRLDALCTPRGTADPDTAITVPDDILNADWGPDFPVTPIPKGTYRDDDGAHRIRLADALQVFRKTDWLEPDDPDAPHTLPDDGTPDDTDHPGFRLYQAFKNLNRQRTVLLWPNGNSTLVLSPDNTLDFTPHQAELIATALEKDQ